MSSDRIDKQVLLGVPRSRAWRAISDSEEFGSWFGVKFDGPFVLGAPLTGVISPTTVDADVAKAQKAYAGAKFSITIDRIEPERLFSFRWHPFAIYPDSDYSAEPTTLVEFVLEEVEEGVQLTISESGFDQIPEARRATAFSRNEQGWSAQIKLVEKYLSWPSDPASTDS